MGEREDLIERIRLKRKIRAQAAQSQEAPAADPSFGQHIQAGIENFGQSATLGYLPRVQAGVGSALGLGEYDQLLKQHQGRHRTQEEQMPKTALAGKALGVLPMLAVPGGAPASVAGAAGRGAAMGALYDPGGEDVVNLPERAKSAAVGGITAGALKGAGKGISDLAAKSQMVQLMKQGKAGAYLKDQLEDSRQAITDKAVKPAMSKLHKLIKGKQNTINPKRLEDISPELDKLTKFLKTKKTPESGGAPLTGPQLQNLKHALKKETKYKKSGALNPNAKYLDSTEKAAKAREAVKHKIEELHPDVKGINQDVQKAIIARDKYKDTENLIEAFKGAKPGTTAHENLRAMDVLSGKNLMGVSSAATAAPQWMLDPTRWGHLLQWPKELIRYGKRTAGAASNLASKVPDPAAQASQEISLRAALEGMREK